MTGISAIPMLLDHCHDTVPQWSTLHWPAMIEYGSLSACSALRKAASMVPNYMKVTIRMCVQLKTTLIKLIKVDRDFRSKDQWCDDYLKYFVVVIFRYE